MSFIRNANKGWLFMSFVCTFGFIWFEGFGASEQFKVDENTQNVLLIEVK